MRCDGLTAPWLIDHPTNREIFDTCVESKLAPTLRKGDEVILDNLASHKSAKAEPILKQRGACFLFPPPYRPDHSGGNPSGYTSCGPVSTIVLTM